MSKLVKAFRGLLAGLMAVSLASVYSGNATVVMADESPFNGADETTLDGRAPAAGNYVDDKGLHVSKYAYLNEDGTYDLKLESYGKATAQTITEPLDIILVLDQSGSMTQNLTSYVARESQGYTYSTIGNNSNYYIEDGGEYYRVTRGGNATRGYWLNYFNVADNVTKYLYGTEIVTTQPEGVPTQTTVIWTGVLYTQQTGGTKLQALKDAVTLFVNNVKTNAIEHDVDHRMSIIGFANGGGNNYNYGNTEYLSTANEVRYDRATAADARDSLVSVKVEDDATNPRLTTAINRLGANGATRADLGFNLANNVVNSRTGADASRKTIIIFFTDGTPTSTDGSYWEGLAYRNHHSSTFDGPTAVSTINTANTLKNGGATIYSIAVLSDAHPYYNPVLTGNNNGQFSSAEQRAVNQYLHLISSNYTGVSAQSSYGREHDTLSNIVWGTGAYTSGKYKKASSASELTAIFDDISKDVAAAQTDLGQQAEMRDDLAANLQLPETGASSVIEVYTADVDTITVDENNNFTSVTFKEPVEAEDPVSLVTRPDGTSSIVGTTVSGFDYKENAVTYNSTTHASSGQKLIIVIRGVTAAELTVGHGDFALNKPESGIYATGSATDPEIAFPNTHLNFPEKSVVLDYAKPITVDFTEGLKIMETDAQGNVTYKDQNLVTMTRIDAAADHLLIGDATATTNNSPYGSFTVDKAGVTATYTPKTMNWDNYDHLFVMGESDSESRLNVWARVNVIPANNVYYEDTFITDNSNGTVGITYTGNVAQEGSDTIAEISDDGSVFGWDEAYNNETGDSAGSSHAMQKSATATFEFTGTGVDIYSRSSSASGIVRVSLYQFNEATQKFALKKLYTCDAFALSGDYYNVPTLSIDLNSLGDNYGYGKYKVEIKVTNSGTDSSLTYYLDGIRIYNPLGDSPTDEEVIKAYTEAGEMDAVFEELRDKLIANNLEDADGTAAVVYLDDTALAEGDALADYTNLGPKNEIYLEQNNTVVFKIDEVNKKYYVGLKALTGTPTNALVPYNAESLRNIAINSTSDRYYEVTPSAEGYISITNNGSGILSITKLRTSHGVIEDGTSITNITAAEAKAFFSRFVTTSVNELGEEVITYAIADGVGDGPVLENPAPQPEDPEIQAPIEVAITENVPAAQTVKNNWIIRLFNGFIGLLRP